MTIPENKFCVYSYEDSEGVFYIGQGTLIRPYQFTKSRNAELMSRLKTGNFTVNILAESLTKRQALNLEHQLILDFKDKSKLLNVQIKSLKSHVELTFNFCDQFWYISENSKTGLKWKKIDKNYSRKIKSNNDAGVINDRGYCSTRILGKQYQCHRIIWVLYNKRDLSPDLIVNHIDSNPLNNNPENLIAITQSQNTFLRNDKHVEGRNATGLAGVIRVGNSWVARGLLNGLEWRKEFCDSKFENGLQLAIDYRDNQQKLKEQQKLQLILDIQTKEKELRDAINHQTNAS